MNTPIIIVGAGAAGIGMGVVLKQLKLPFVILDQGQIGQSFLNWPKETRFISPSFTGNAFGAVDLNAVTPDTSPAFTLFSEHPSGFAYAQYLNILVDFFELPVKTHVCVDGIKRDGADFILESNQGQWRCQHLIWAAGEFQYPNLDSFAGADNCLHYSEIDSWSDLSGDDFAIIGGYESGVDAAYQLIQLGKKVHLFDGENQLSKHSSDSSYSLSPFTRGRLAEVGKKIQITTSHIQKVEAFEDGYTLHTADGEKYSTANPPINCSGFATSLSKMRDFFAFEDGKVQLSDCDESTICPNLFLTGPQVRHGEIIFCFIYKFRQRFAVIGEELSRRLNADAALCQEVIDYYQDNQFYLKDLSCCEDECSC